MIDDPQVTANEFAHSVDYGDGHELVLVGVTDPVRPDAAEAALPRPSSPATPMPSSSRLGWDTDRIIEAKISGAVI